MSQRTQYSADRSASASLVLRHANLRSGDASCILTVRTNMEESQDLAAGITRRLRTLQTYSLPQLAGCNGDAALYDELAGDISQSTQIIEGEVEVS